MKDTELKNLNQEGRMAIDYGELKILATTSHIEMAKRVAEKIAHDGINLIVPEVKKFDDGEIYARIPENVRGSDLFIISSLHSHGEIDTLKELLLLTDAARSAHRRVAILPFCGYAKQDRPVVPREAWSFKVLAKILSQSGLNRIVLYDLHNSTCVGFFDVETDNLYLMRLLIEEAQKLNLNNIAIVSPDVNSGKRAKAIAKIMKIDQIGIIWKYRDPVSKEIDERRSQILGDVDGKNVLMFDDMIQGGGTLAIAGRILKAKGALSVHAFAVHPDLTVGAIEKLANSELDEIALVDTIPQNTTLWPKKIRLVDPSQFIADCIKRIHYNEPLSPLYINY